MSKEIAAGLFDASKIFFRVLTREDCVELRNLHQEWFPLRYGEDFYNRVTSGSIIAIGCFYRFRAGQEEAKIQNGDVSQDIIIGTILSKFKKTGDGN